MKFKQTMQMIEDGEYFTINRPHQYGKTTMLRLLTQQLNASEEWMAIRVSFEGMDDEMFSSGKLFSAAFLAQLELQMLELNRDDLVMFLKKEIQRVEILGDLSRSITALAHTVDRKMVLLIDEVDSSSSHELFLKFLGVLRHKYLNRDLKTERTFHSVVLTGVHDIKTLKLKIRPLRIAAPYNSPWNIAANFKVDMNFHVDEITPMLEEYARERKVTLDASSLAKQLFGLTSGYPFLLSGICKIFDEEILPQKKDQNWTADDLNRAAQLFVTNPYGNTNFDHLIKNLENYPELYQLVFEILVEKQHYNFNIQDPVIHLGVLYGIFDYEVGNGLKIHNRIYSELIFNYMTSKIKRQVSMEGLESKSEYVLPDNQLNLSKVLDRFQRFMQEQESNKDQKFLEKNGRLLFLGFLQPIINGGGYVFKESQISDEKRLDLVITYYQHKYIIELKIWRGAATHNKGLDQLADYLDRQQIDEGYLLIFDLRKVHKSTNKQCLEVNGKRVYAVWV